MVSRLARTCASNACVSTGVLRTLDSSTAIASVFQTATMRHRAPLQFAVRFLRYALDGDR